MTGLRRRVILATVAAVALAAVTGATALQGKAQTGDGTMPPATIDWNHVPYNPAVAAKSTQGVRGMVAARDDVDRTMLPILLPDASTGVDRSALNFSSEGDVYDINLPQATPGLRVLLSGNRVYVPVEPGTLKGIKYDRVVMGGQVVNALIQRTEDGWLASFMRFNVSYTVEVICDEAPAEGYCADDAYIRKVTSGMTEVVLGAAGLKDQDLHVDK